MGDDHCINYDSYKRWCPSGQTTCGNGANVQAGSPVGDSETGCKAQCKTDASCVAIAYKSNDSVIAIAYDRHCVTYHGNCDDSNDGTNWGYQYFRKLPAVDLFTANGEGTCRINGQDDEGWGCWGSGSGLETTVAAECAANEHCYAYWFWEEGVDQPGDYQIFCDELNGLCDKTCSGDVTLVRAGKLQGRGPQGTTQTTPCMVSTVKRGTVSLTQDGCEGSANNGAWDFTVKGSVVTISNGVTGNVDASGTITWSNGFVYERV